MDDARGRLLKSVVAKMRDGQPDEAVRELRAARKEGVIPESDTHALEVAILEEAGRYEEAYGLVRSRIVRVDQVDYSGYVGLLTMGGLAEALGRRDEAAAWYVKAIDVSITDSSVSGAGAVRLLLRVRAHVLSEAEVTLSWRALLHAWKALRLDGEPNRLDMAGTIDRLMQAQGRPPRA